MSNKRKLDGSQKVHVSYQGTGFRLCNVRKRGRTTNVAEEVTCEACGKAALRLVKALEAEQEEREAQAQERQAEGVRLLSQPRWWEKQEGGSDG